MDRHRRKQRCCLRSRIINPGSYFKAPYEVKNGTPSIRDSHDEPALRDAIASQSDVLLTGDKDFLEAEIKDENEACDIPFLCVWRL